MVNPKQVEGIKQQDSIQIIRKVSYAFLESDRGWGVKSQVCLKMQLYKS